MESWKDVVGYEGLYQVSDFGNVRSCARSVRHRWGGYRTVKGKSVSLCVHKRGYVVCGLMKDGQWKQKQVHALVLSAFCGLPSVGQESRHGDNNRQNNRLSNLCWGTRTENAADKVRHGSDPVGIRNGRSILTEEDVLRVVELAKSMTQTGVVLMTGFNQVTVNHILRGRTWSHLTGISRLKRHTGVTGAFA